MIYFVSRQISLADPLIIHQDSLDDCLAYIRNRSALACDTETTGLNFLDDRLLLTQIGDQERQYVIDCTTIDASPLKSVLENKQVVKLFHNAGFDYPFLKHNLGAVCENVYDTMLAEQVIHCGKESFTKFKKYSLASVVERRLKLTLTKGERMEFLHFRGTFNAGQITYAANDLVHLFAIREQQMKEADKLGLTLVTRLENNAVLAYSDMYVNGISLDETKWLENAQVAHQELHMIHSELYNMLESESIFSPLRPIRFQLDLFSTDTESSRQTLEKHFNFKSPVQMLQLLWLLDPTITSAAKEVLEKRTDLHPIISVYLNYKKTDKLYSSYGPQFLESRWSDGKIHAQVKQILNTGRISMKAPAMQTLPATNLYRNCFVTGDPDWVFVSSDYSSQELAITAEKSGDPVWVMALKQGRDLHSVCAALMYGEQWSSVTDDGCAYYHAHVDRDGVYHLADSNLKCECKGHQKLRKRSKAINLGLCYGMTEHKLANDLNISVDEAKTIIARYFATFPSIKSFLDKQGRLGTATGQSRTYPPYNRVRWYEEWSRKRHDGQYMGEVERASKNSPIQGSASDMVKESLILIRRRIIDQQLPVKLVMTVHDQIDTICHKDYADQWAVELTAIMEKAARRILPSGLLKAETSQTLVWSK